MVNVAIYARVSSERQKDDHTIDSQVAAIRAHAKELGHEVPPNRLFQDEGHSGATIQRPALERLRDLAAQIQIDLVLCYSPDRLARKYAYQALLIEEFSRVGTEVRFVKGPKSDTPEDQLLLQFQGMIAEYERAQIADRTRRGKLHRARSGAVNVLSNAPYGYRYIRKNDDENARYDVDSDQATVVREIFDLYVRQQYSMGAIARSLTEQGILTATGKTRWDRSTIWGMLRNPAYYGRAAFGKTMVVSGQARVTRQIRMKGGESAHRPKSRERSKEDWIEIPVPAIIGEVTFELAARRLADNKRFASRNTKVPSLLQGLLVCQHCGYSYYRASTKTSARKLYYYRCLGSDDYRYEEGRVCENKPIRQDALDRQIWDHVTMLLANPKLIKQELSSRLHSMHKSNPVGSEQATLKKELKKVIAAKVRITEAYQEGLLLIEELRERIPQLRKREATLNSKLQALEANLIDEKAYLKLTENLDNFLAKLSEAAKTVSVVERQKVLRLVVKEIVVGQDNIVIRHTISTSNPAPPAGYLLCGRGHYRSLRRPDFGLPFFTAFHY